MTMYRGYTLVYIVLRSTETGATKQNPINVTYIDPISENTQLHPKFHLLISEDDKSALLLEWMLVRRSIARPRGR